jgi:hypothetical protein
MRAAPSKCTAPADREAGANDIGLRHPARYGQNDPEIVVGRKAWLFSDTPAGAIASARLYSLIETAKASGLEPYAYLKRLFAELPALTTVAEIETLLPWNVARPATQSVAA